MKILMLAVMFCSMACSSPSLYQLTELDPNDTEAVKLCAQRDGLAGWLQHIEEDGDYINPPANLYCVTRPR